MANDISQASTISKQVHLHALENPANPEQAPTNMSQAATNQKQALTHFTQHKINPKQVPMNVTEAAMFKLL